MAFLSDADISTGLLKSASAQTQVLAEAARASGKDLFLSYSSGDRVLITGVLDFLEDQGAAVYVDVHDQRLPRPPSVHTANILRVTHQTDHSDHSK